MTLLEVMYSEAVMANCLGDWSLEALIEGTTVSAIAIRVVHCESVKTSPSFGGGSAAARGAKAFNSVLVMEGGGNTVKVCEEATGVDGRCRCLYLKSNRA